MPLETRFMIPVITVVGMQVAQFDEDVFWSKLLV